MITSRAVILGLCVCVAVLVYALVERDVLWAKVPVDCFDPTERERVRELSLGAIDKGFEQAVMHLYTVWQKDPDTDQPKRARVGIVNALNAHNRARKYTLAWSPPPCESTPQ